MLAVVALVAVVAAAIWATVSDGGSSGEREVAPGPGSPSTTPAAEAWAAPSGRTLYLWDPNTGDMTIVHPSDGQLKDVEFSPDGDRVVFERRDPDTGRDQIYLLGADGVERRLTTKRVGAYDPTWSPDGTQIAFAARPGGSRDRKMDTDIFVMHADGGNIRLLAGTVGNDVDPDWSPDGSRIAFQGLHDDNRGLIWVASVRTGELTRLTQRHTYSEMDPAWSPDGRWIAYTRYHHGNTLNGHIYGAELWLMRSDGSDERAIVTRGSGRVSENPSWSPDGRLIVFERHDWSWGNNRVLVVDPRTGRMHPVFVGAEAAVPGVGNASPSWGTDGVLLSLPSRNPAPSPGPTPAWLRVQGGNVVGSDGNGNG